MKAAAAVSLLLLLLVASCGGAQDADESAAAAAPPGSWRVIPEESTLGFEATQTGESFKGAFRNFSAVIVFNPADLTSASIEVTVDMTSARTGDRQRDQALPSNDWFAAKDHPTATYSSNEVVRDGGNYIAHGTLLMHGVERPLDLPFSVQIDGSRAAAEGAATILRTDWGVGQGEFETDQWVGLDVRIFFDITVAK